MTRISGSPRSLAQKAPLQKLVRLKVERYPWPGSPDTTSGIVQNLGYAAVTVDTTYSTYYGSNALDGSTGTGYHSNDSGDAWLKVDFGENWLVNITHWGVYAIANAGQHTPRLFDLDVSKDDSTWSQIYNNTSTLTVDAWSGGAVDSRASGWHRYARIHQPAGGSSNSSSYIFFGELEFWGSVIRAKDYELVEIN